MVKMNPQMEHVYDLEDNATLFGQDGNHVLDRLWSTRILPIFIILLASNYITSRFSVLRANILNEQYATALLIGLLQVADTLLRHFRQSRRPAPKDCAVDGATCLTWFLLSFLLRRSMSNEIQCLGRRAVITWLVAVIISWYRFIDLSLQLFDHKYPSSAEANCATVAWALVCGLYVISLAPVPRPIILRHAFPRSCDTSKEFNGRTQRLASSHQTCHENASSTAEEGAGLVSKITFQWIAPLIRRGTEGVLQSPADAFHLPNWLKADYVEEHFFKELSQGSAMFGEDVQPRTNTSTNKETSSAERPNTYDKERSDKQGNGIRSMNRKHRVTLSQALFHSFAFHSLFMVGLVRFINSVFTMLVPVALNALITFLADDEERMANGLFYALGISLFTLLGDVFGVHFEYMLKQVQVRARSALISTIYHKSLSISAVTRSAFTTGNLMSFMNADIDKIVDFCFYFHGLWSFSLELAISLYLLYQQVGCSFLAAVIITIILTPVTTYLGNRTKKLHNQMLKCRDNRIQILTEILKGIRAIKFYSWERYFTEQALDVRSQELRNLRAVKTLDAFINFAWITTPTIISLFTFATYVMLGNELTAAKVFTSMFLISILIIPLNALPSKVKGMSQARISLMRAQKFIDVPDIDTETFYRSEDMLREEEDLCIDRAVFSWNPPVTSSEVNLNKNYQNGTSFRGLNLQDIKITILKGQLVGVIGRVGSGKSSFLSAVTAEMLMECGLIAMSNAEQGFGLATQEPWLQQKSVKDNILFGKPFDAKWYYRVLTACALLDDLKNMPAGDESEIGDNGITLSGGQKARVALARAMYQDKDIILLDDPFASVDAKVGEHIFSRCILELLGKKTRILCTHHIPFVERADIVIVMDEGKIVDIGPPASVLPRFHTHSKETEQEINSYSRLSDAAVKSSLNKQLVEEKRMSKGVVSFDVYRSYMSAAGKGVVTCVMVSLVLMQVSKNVSDLWLSHWTRHTSEDVTTSDTTAQWLNSSALDSSAACHPQETVTGEETMYTFAFYLVVYGILVVCNTMSELLRRLFFAYGGIRAATRMHDRLLNNVIKATVHYFDKTPQGRIIDHFSTDVLTVDTHLPLFLNALLSKTCKFLGCVVITCYSLPWSLLVVLPVGAVFCNVQGKYRVLSLDLRRMAIMSRSVMHSHFSETLAGLTVVKAMRATKRFGRENREKMEWYQRAWFSSECIAVWLQFRLRMIGVAMVTVVAILAVLEHGFHSLNPGLIGLVITYGLTIAGPLISVVKLLTETEKNIISAERIQQCIENVPQECTLGCKVATQWPDRGVVKFSNVHFSYPSNGAKALDGVNFETLPEEKIGVMGRTGSGKSTLFLVLFKMVEIEEGEVTIDGLNIADLSVHDIRSRLAIIPQDPFLFSSSVRDNVDPLNQFSDQEIQSVLEKCQLTDTISRMGGLGVAVGEGGKGFSTGQKQLICLARAILKRAKVLCIDEGTASVDMETDKLLQAVIRSEFSRSTVLTIAHRHNTIIDSNRILTMNAGKVVGFEMPRDVSIPGENGVNQE